MAGRRDRQQLPGPGGTGVLGQQFPHFLGPGIVRAITIEPRHQHPGCITTGRDGQSIGDHEGGG